MVLSQSEITSPSQYLLTILICSERQPCRNIAFLWSLCLRFSLVLSLFLQVLLSQGWWGSPGPVIACLETPWTQLRGWKVPACVCFMSLLQRKLGYTGKVHHILLQKPVQNRLFCLCCVVDHIAQLSSMCSTEMRSLDQSLRNRVELVIRLTELLFLGSELANWWGISCTWPLACFSPSYYSQQYNPFLVCR